MCAVVSGSLWGCRETNQREPDAGLKIITESISVSAEGGEAVIEFTIDEAVESEAIIVHPRDGWVHSPEIFMPNVNSTDGKIVLTVDANTGSDLRATEVEVMYNNTEDLSNVVSIIQGGEPSGFEISVTDITTYSVVASIIPVDKELTYFASLIAKDDYSEFNNDQELFDYNYNLWVENFPSIEDFLANGLQQGDLKDTVTSLLQDTEYFIYAYGVDNATGEVLTSLYKAEFKSEAVCKIDMSIGINVTVDGNNAEVTYTPSDNTVPYFNSITTKSDLEEYGGNIEEQVGEFINEFIGFLLGFTPYDFFEYMSDYGEKTYSRSSMEVESDYIAFAVAWDGGCNMISNVFSNEFRTEDIHPSDNEITLKVWSPGSRSVFYEVQTTNEDPYVIRWLNSEEVENMTNQEIFEYLLEIYPPDDYFNSLDN